VRAAPLLVADEATASVDQRTDAVVQGVLADLDATIVVVAHRLRTVAAFDAVLVLDAGAVMEMGPPAALLGREGPFLALCRRSGELEEIRRLAAH
jgi:ABC-type multidrug transport system fused ATPase/permease subunit